MKRRIWTTIVDLRPLYAKNADDSLEMFLSSCNLGVSPVIMISGDRHLLTNDFLTKFLYDADEITIKNIVAISQTDEFVNVYEIMTDGMFKNVFDINTLKFDDRASGYCDTI